MTSSSYSTSEYTSDSGSSSESESDDGAANFRKAKEAVYLGTNLGCSGVDADQQPFH